MSQRLYIWALWPALREHPLASHHNQVMKVFGIAGRSGMGKTSLLERLVPVLTGQGLRVSLVKHSHKDIDIDRPGKDSYRLREAGCQEILLLGQHRWALMHELRGAPEPPLEALLGHIQVCDLVLIEGFKSGAFPKLEVWREAVGKPSLWREGYPGLTAVVSDSVSPSDCALPWLDITQEGSIALHVLAHALELHSQAPVGTSFGS